MDIFHYRNQHKVELNCILEIDRETPKDENLTALLNKTKWLLQKELNLKWHIATLSHYHNLGIVPRSLRWDVAPEYQGDDNIEDDEWAEFFVKCGLDLIKFIIKRKQKKLQEIQGKIEELREKLEPNKNDEEYKLTSENIQLTLEKKEQEIIKRKNGKYRRDMGDFKNGRIFKWQIQSRQRYYQRTTNLTNTDRPSNSPIRLDPSFQQRPNRTNAPQHINRGWGSYNPRPQSNDYSRPNRGRQGPWRGGSPLPQREFVPTRARRGRMDYQQRPRYINTTSPPFSRNMPSSLLSDSPLFLGQNRGVPSEQRFAEREGTELDVGSSTKRKRVQ